MSRHPYPLSMARFGVGVSGIFLEQENLINHPQVLDSSMLLECESLKAIGLRGRPPLSKNDNNNQNLSQIQNKEIESFMFDLKCSLGDQTLDLIRDELSNVCCGEVTWRNCLAIVNKNEDNSCIACLKDISREDGKRITFSRCILPNLLDDHTGDVDNGNSKDYNENLTNSETHEKDQVEICKNLNVEKLGNLQLNAKILQLEETRFGLVLSLTENGLSAVSVSNDAVSLVAEVAIKGDRSRMIACSDSQTIQDTLLLADNSLLLLDGSLGEVQKWKCCYEQASWAGSSPFQILLSHNDTLTLGDTRTSTLSTLEVKSGGRISNICANKDSLVCLSTHSKAPPSKQVIRDYTSSQKIASKNLSKRTRSRRNLNCDKNYETRDEDNFKQSDNVDCVKLYDLRMMKTPVLEYHSALFGNGTINALRFDETGNDLFLLLENLLTISRSITRGRPAIEIIPIQGLTGWSDSIVATNDGILCQPGQLSDQILSKCDSQPPIKLTKLPPFYKKIFDPHCAIVESANLVPSSSQLEIRSSIILDSLQAAWSLSSTPNSSKIPCEPIDKSE